MSFSRNQQVLVYIPVTEAALPKLHVEFPLLHKLGLVDGIFHALTSYCHVETLQMVTVLQTVENYLDGRGHTFFLSALMRDSTGKLQTEEMKLLHDVMVEMPMNSYGYSELQRVLGAHGMQFVMMHSCGSDIIPEGHKSFISWWNRIKNEQMTRTWLDWSTTTEPSASNNEIIERTWMTRRDFDVIDRIFSFSKILSDMLYIEVQQKLAA